MAIQWGGWAGHMRVGIEVANDAIAWNTSSVNVAVTVYIQADSTWSFNDGQTITLTGDAGGTWNFQNTLGPNAVYNVGGSFVPGGATPSYGGGPQYRFKAQLSGHYQGAAPFAEVYYTLPAKPPFFPTPPGVWADEVTNTSARIVVWQNADNGSAIVEHQSQIATDTGFTANLRTGAGTHTETGLTPATKYYARGRTRNGVGWSGWSTTDDFTTGATVPAAPVLTVGTVGETTTAYTWTVPANGGSTITTYETQLATDSAFTQNTSLTAGLKGTSGTLSSLVPGRQYWVRNRAVNGVGAGPWGAAKSFTTLAGTPTIVNPVQNGTYGNGILDVTVQAVGIASDRTITVEVAKNNTFTTDLRTVTLNPSGPSSDNKYRLLAANQYLSSGTWYARAKVRNNTTAYTTPYSSIITFVQAHAPTTTISGPTAGAVQRYASLTPFSWSIKDSAAPNDWQTAYRLQVENNATGEVVYDSNKTAMVTSPNDQIITVNVALASTLKAVGLRWRVMVWDRADTASAWTGYGLFTLADPPVVSPTTPASGAAVDNGAPTFSWAAAFPSGGTQVRAIVSVFDAGTNELAWTGTVSGSATSIKPPIVILRNANSYYWTLKILDSMGLESTATSPFTTSYSSPNTVRYRVDATHADDLGYVNIDWADANADDLFAAWKVYRRTVTDAWELIATITNQNVRQHHDYLLRAGDTYSYSVTQVATRSGSLLESPVGYYTSDEDVTTAEARWFYVDLTQYWIVHPVEPSMSVRLVNVVNDDSTLQFEQASYNIIGRGRHVDYGDELGYSGTLTCNVRIPERTSTFRRAMEALRRAKQTYYLRTPFGQLFPIALGDLSWAPVGGVGTVEMGDMGIPYEEVH